MQPWCVRWCPGKSDTQERLPSVPVPQGGRAGASSGRLYPRRRSPDLSPRLHPFCFRRSPDRRTGHARDATSPGSPRQALRLRNLQEGRSQVPYPAGDLGQLPPLHEPLGPANLPMAVCVSLGDFKGGACGSQGAPASSSQTALGPSSWEVAARSPRGPAAGERHAAPWAARGKGKSKPDNSVGHAQLSEKGDGDPGASVSQGHGGGEAPKTRQPPRAP